MRIRVLSPAQDEIRRTIDFYDQKAAGLGHDFLDELDKIWVALLDHPELGARYGHNVRRAVLTRFPFAVFYSLEPNEIVVHAVAHQRQRPDYWIQRR